MVCAFELVIANKRKKEIAKLNKDFERNIETSKTYSQHTQTQVKKQRFNDGLHKKSRLMAGIFLNELTEFCRRAF